MNPKKLAWPKYWQEGIRDLSASDSILAKIIQRNKEIKLYSHQDPFLTLFRAIVSQQISSVAAKKLSAKMAQIAKNVKVQTTNRTQLNK